LRKRSSTDQAMNQEQGEEQRPMGASAKRKRSTSSTNDNPLEVHAAHAQHSSDVNDSASAHNRSAASRLLWSRLAELEQMRNRLAKLNELVCAVVDLHCALTEQLEEQMRQTLDYTTSATGKRQRVDASFSVVLNEVIRQLDQ
jgi:hypothetical protein